MGSLKISVSDSSFKGIASAVLDKVADKIFSDSQRNIVDKGVVDEGSLLKSGNVLREPLKKTILYNSPYADVIEFGRLPGSFVPIQPLIGWVRRKLGVKDEKKARSIAYAIANDIKKRGTKPRPYIGPAIENARNIRIK
jgi:hypothetical protein